MLAQELHRLAESIPGCLVERRVAKLRLKPAKEDGWMDGGCWLVLVALGWLP